MHSRLLGTAPWINASYINEWANMEDARLDPAPEP